MTVGPISETLLPPSLKPDSSEGAPFHRKELLPERLLDG